MVYLEAFSKVLPVLLLIGLGAVLRRFGFLSEAAIHGFKQLVVNITLSAALFLAFAGVSLEGGHLVIVALVFLLCLLALWAPANCSSSTHCSQHTKSISWPRPMSSRPKSSVMSTRCVGYRSRAKHSMRIVAPSMTPDPITAGND